MIKKITLMLGLFLAAFISDAHATWYTVYDSNTSSDFASSHGPVGAGQILVNGWTDQQGSVYTTASGILSTNPSSGGFDANVLSRPSNENAADAQIIFDVTTGLTQTTETTQGYVRWNGQLGTNFSGYAALVAWYASPAVLDIAKVVNASVSVPCTANFSPGYNSSHTYEITFSATGSSTTVLTASVTDLTTSSVVASTTCNDTSSPFTSGGTMLTDTNATGSTYPQWTRVRTYVDQQSMILTPTSGAGSSSISVSVKGIGTSWTSGTTFSSSGLSGTSVVTNSVNASTQTASITITTGSTSGTATISDSTDSVTSSFTVSSIVPVTSSAFYFSPLGWYLNGSTSAETNTSGAYFYFSFTGTTATLNFNTSNLGSNPLIVRYSVDGAPFVDTDIENTSSLSLGGTLSNAAHNIVVYYRGRTYQIDSWNTPSDGFLITGMTLSSGATLGTPTVKPYTMLVYGDSRVEGINDLPGQTGGTAAAQDETLVTGFLIAQALNAEVGMRAFGGMDYTVQGVTNVPGLFTPGDDATSSWNKYWSGKSMLDGNGHYVTQPNYIFVLNLGVNGRGVSESVEQAAAFGFMNAARGAAPNAIIYIGNGSYEGYQSTAITAAYNQYQAATPDSKLILLNYGISAALQASMIITNAPNPTDYCVYDGVHPDYALQALIASTIIKSFSGNSSVPSGGCVGSG